VQQGWRRRRAAASAENVQQAAAEAAQKGRMAEHVLELG
jgi:hypothetical protein